MINSVFSHNLCLSDEEVESVKSHYGELDPELEAELRDDGPEADGYFDIRLRYRRLLEVWAGRKAAKHDVHTSHCCEKHGCKYGDDDCPVAAKAAPQEHLCEECEQDVWSLRAAMPRAEEYARSVAFLDQRSGNYLIVDGERLRLAKPEPREGLSEPVLLKAQHSDLVWAIQRAYLAGVV